MGDADDKMFSGYKLLLQDTRPRGEGRNSTVLETLGSSKGLIDMTLFLFYLIFFKFKVYSIMI